MRAKKITENNLSILSTAQANRHEAQRILVSLLSHIDRDKSDSSVMALLFPLNAQFSVTSSFVIAKSGRNDEKGYLLLTKSKRRKKDIHLSAMLTTMSKLVIKSDKAQYRNLDRAHTYITVGQSKRIKVKNVLMLPIAVSDGNYVVQGFINKRGQFTGYDISAANASRLLIRSMLLSEANSRCRKITGRKSLNLRDNYNVTELKRFEEEAAELHQRALTSSHLASIGELASGIAHEVNNPLASIVLYTQLLMEEDLPAKTKNDVQSIYESAQRAINIIRRLLTFARQQLQQKIATNINEMIAVTLELRKYALETSNIRVSTELAQNLPLTLADAGQIQQVFLNIVLNAEAEMKLGHGKGNLFIKTELVDNTIKVSFKDDGPGIKSENMKKIFNPFFTTREVGEGTGLGLSICHGIVADHDGKIYAESEPGEGATFYVELPVIPCRQIDIREELGRPAGNEGQRRRILIVDDELSILDSLSRLLAMHGYKVDTVDNCLSALDMILGEQYDCILLDIKLPGMSGIELYKEIKNIDASLVRKVAFVTGNIMEKETRQFLQDNPVTYFVKPFEMKHLIKELDILIKRVN